MILLGPDYFRTTQHTDKPTLMHDTKHNTHIIPAMNITRDDSCTKRRYDRERGSQIYLHQTNRYKTHLHKSTKEEARLNS